MYVELHAHSNFSFLRGASHPEELVEAAAELGYDSMALTDTNGLYGAVRFDRACREHGLRPIFGAEVTLEGDPSPGRKRRASASPAGGGHLVLLARTGQGYANLSTLLSKAATGHPKGHARVSLSQLGEHSAGLFGLSGCLRGAIPSALARGERGEAARRAAELAELFEPSTFFLELWDHRTREEAALSGALARLGRELGLPPVATGNVHYARPDGRKLCDVLFAIRHHTTLDAAGTRLLPNAEFYLQPPAEMQRRFAAWPEAIENTCRIATACTFELASLSFKFPPCALPDGETPGGALRRLSERGYLSRYDGRDPGLREAALRQIEHELAIVEKLELAGYFLIVWDVVRFCREQGILCQGRGSAANSAVCYCLGITAVDPVGLGLLFERFLSEDRREAPDIDLDIEHERREEVLQYVYERYGRDHAGMVAEVISYRGRSAIRDVGKALGFSLEQVDRLAGALELHSPPGRRPGLPEEEPGSPAGGVGQLPANQGRYHRGTEAQRHREVSGSPGIDSPSVSPCLCVSVMGQPRSSSSTRAMRPASEVVEQSPESIDEQAGSASLFSLPGPGWGSHPGEGSGAELPTDSHSPSPPAGSPPRASSPPPPAWLAAEGFDGRDQRLLELVELTRAIQRFPRHLGIHVGGMVITEAPLSQVVPIENAAMPGRTVIQWDKDDVSDCGLVKIDLLGLGMLSMIGRAIRLVKEHRGVTLDPALLTYDDPAVYDLLCAADTVGVFQVESRAQMATLPRLRPRCFYDLVVEVALIRPGPIQGDMVHPYLRRRAGEEPVTYPHPCLEPVLKRTLGIPLFQEQGMRVAIVAAGFTPGEADQLRRAMGHKRSRERMEALAAKLITGMVASGIAAETARNIYRQLAAFADYGFPESHAASFALLVYVSAHLKRYWPAEFTCALLNAQPMGFYSPATLLEDARRHGVEVGPIDLALSRWECTLESGGEPARGPRTDGDPASGARPAATRSPLAVRLGLRYVKGLGESAREQLEKALPFGSLEQVVERGGLPSAVLERLAAIGACSGFGLERRQALWRLHELLARPPGLPRRAAPRPAPAQSPLPEMTAIESMVADYRSTGLTTGPHPMAFLRAELSRKRVMTAARLLDCPDGRRVRVAGLVIARQRPPTAGAFLFMTLEDETGLANVVVKPWLVEREGPVVCRAAVLLVEGTMQEEKTVRNIVAARVEELAFPDPRVQFRSRDFR